MGIKMWKLALLFFLIVFIVSSMICISFFLGERHHCRATGEPYESGIPPTPMQRQQYAGQYFLIALFFVVFDIEVLFLTAWAIAVKAVGWTGFIEISIFIGVLLAALLFLWKEGALDWGTIAKLKQKKRSIAQNGFQP